MSPVDKSYEDNKISTLFLDIGGVLLSNGWGRNSRKRAAEQFQFDLDEMNDRHQMTFDTYEMGKITLDDYLLRTVFYQPRSFSPDEFKRFMFAESTEIAGAIDFFKELKKIHGLQVIAVNNEGRELNEYRIRQFHLKQLFNAFASSCYLHLRKPDKDIFSLALDMAQTSPKNALMVDDRLMFVEVAATTGMNAVQFKSLDDFKKLVEQFKF